ncbi:uncharacterized protein Z519_03525 [Cladophialophora bantiana CBS 173.52]|uniref:Uncharacterized protein n=1 Tax=Cladophialophora bantiana (strain ATCC 10958 / CBS 173.52 / CDC B-1940 / NIH 8579) TaxID=1442370 RepID=A0A0D2F2P1_CLAB1|nr:uncharacterized protein Z519_03525 [Cladophialophora bantiana CBS 173.52]KIW96456.1 hypothetical protein Z519_03525 [Cladophialophora bantiana CBS 173.52]
MKPVVSALNAWSCTILSVFAIVILSIIGSLFARDHHSMMGLEGDPEDGGAVAGSIFIAVAVYAARHSWYSVDFKLGCMFERVGGALYHYDHNGFSAIKEKMLSEEMGKLTA